MFMLVSPADCKGPTAWLAPRLRYGHIAVRPQVQLLICSLWGRGECPEGFSTLKLAPQRFPSYSSPTEKQQ